MVPSATQDLSETWEPSISCALCQILAGAQKSLQDLLSVPRRLSPWVVIAVAPLQIAVGLGTVHSCSWYQYQFLGWKAKCRQA